MKRRRLSSIYHCAGRNKNIEELGITTNEDGTLNLPDCSKVSSFGKLLTLYRIKLRLTEGELSNSLQVSRQSVIRWESEKGIPQKRLLPVIRKRLFLSEKEYTCLLFRHSEFSKSHPDLRKKQKTTFSLQFERKLKNERQKKWRLKKKTLHQ